MKRTSKKQPKQTSSASVQKIGKRKEKPQNNYKSKFENTVSEYFQHKLQYEPDRLHYMQPAIRRAYVPDFKVSDTFYLECKGYWTSEDRHKHLHFRESNPGIRIVFIFMDANKKIHPKSNTTYADWCNKNGFEWYCWKHRKPTFDLVSKDNGPTKTSRRAKRNNLLDKPRI